MNKYDPNFVQIKNYAVIAQKAIVLNDKNEILLLNRSQKSGKGGRWDFCGGGLEKDETPIEGIQREIREESGLEVKDIKPIAVTSFTNEDLEIMIGYQAKAITEHVILSWEHDEYIWKTKDEALKLELPAFFNIMVSSLIY